MNVNNGMKRIMTMENECLNCPYSRNCLNGLYCTIARIYVQYGSVKCVKEGDERSECHGAVQKKG